MGELGLEGQELTDANVSSLKMEVDKNSSV
jgi:hypothetical protein